MPDVFFTYLVISLLALLAFFISYFFWRQHRFSVLRKSLTYSLYEVSFPHFQKKQNQQEEDNQKMFGAMEQFYAGMSGVKPCFALEIASPSTENEVNFYVSVPREYEAFLRRQVNSVFPNAQIREERSDYNIFKHRSPSAGSIIRLKKNDILPIKTYEHFKTDPLEIVINSLSSLSRKTEGAALQIIVNTEEGNLGERVDKSLSLLQSGAPIEDAIRGSSVVGEFFRFFSGKTDNIQKTEKIPGLTPLAEEARTGFVELLKTKKTKQSFRTNIRIVSSAESAERANSILDEIKSLFLQFADPVGNSFVARSLGVGRLKNFLFNFSFRLFNESTSFYLNTAELSSIFHFPANEIFAPGMKFQDLKSVESPSILQSSGEGILLGNNNFRDVKTDVRIANNDRRRHLYIIGQTGTGKSVLMKNMILQDIRNGEGVCFVDPHGSDVEDILGQIPKDRWEDVIYFNPSDVKRPLGLNMLEYDENYPEHKTLVVNELLEIFNKLYDMRTAGGPLFEQYFRNAALLVMEDPSSGSTLLEISKVLSDDNFRKLKLSKSKNPVVNDFWIKTAQKAGGESALQNMVPYITSKFDTFLSNEIMRPIIAQEKSAFNFRDIMDNRKIFLVNLSKGRIGETNAHLLGMILVGKIFMSAMSRVDVAEENRKDFYFYIDEFQNVTTKTIVSILSEARKYRLSLTIGHQFIGQLEEEIKKAVFGNVGSIVSFRVGNEDAEIIAKQFEPVFSAEDLINLPNYNAYIKLLINGKTSRPFNMQALPPEKTDTATAEKVKELSSIKFGRPTGEIEREISKRFLIGKQEND
ncbi:MAG: type IV secretion system DNA-binding domain-containing protein [Candidatus Marinimicrobia bacterium]|nr:type IV secretion system DNA-binding domain-containing protein [Candidatus Neomarinimicrobiota bacterium]